MAASRDDFVIAIRSAFLKKSNKQRFSLIVLILFSVGLIFLSSLNFKAISYVKIGLNVSSGIDSKLMMYFLDNIHISGSALIIEGTDNLLSGSLFPVSPSSGDGSLLPSQDIVLDY